jgi:hypothetical protein
MKKGFINEAFRLQQLAGIAPINEIGFQTEQDSKGEVIDLYHLDDETIPDQAVDIIQRGTISNEEYITGILGKTVDFDSEEAEEVGAFDYDEVPFDYLVDLGICTDSNTLATIKIGGTYVENNFFFDQGNGYVVTIEDYTGSWGVTTKQAADEAIQYMKTL